jgi:hypothetical protein
MPIDAMPYRVFEPQIEILGAAVNATVAGFGPFKSIVENLLARGGLASQRESGDTVVDLEAWYPQQAWLDALREVDERFGGHVLFKIGAAIPKTAVFPPTVVDIHSGLASIDVAYHINHRRQGTPMFDDRSGAMLEGIGHYGYERVTDHEVRMRCWTPYPCRFDLGIVTAMARRFEPAAAVVHGPDCRHHDAEACEYRVSWPD